ncbi:MAG: GspE/PulE family protein [Patescibacteria group bacterium]
MNSFSIKTIPGVLMEKGYISEEQMNLLKKRALDDGRAIEDLVLEERIVSEEDLIKIKAETLNIPYIDLSGEMIPPEVLGEFPLEVAIQYKFIPFRKEKNSVFVAMVDPEDVSSLEALKFIALRKGFDWKIFITSPANLQEALRQYSSLTSEVGQALETLKKEREKEFGKEGAITAKEIEKIAQEAPISKVVSVILKHAVEGRASDIHIEPMENELRVRYRVDGVMFTSLILAKKIAPAIVARIKVLSNLKLDEQRKPQDGRFHAEVSGRGIDFRVSTLPIAEGEKVVMRILDKTSGVKRLSDLGFSENGQKLLNEAINKPYGTVLITGPTGSGKSTTLYAMLGMLNEIGVNIITLEDPVEYRLEGINQSQIRPEIGYTFAAGLRSILRQDPDIIMVGEIRDGETAELAVHAALTGHIVLSTLHTNSAVGAIPRLIDMGIEPFLVTSALNVVISQRLVQKICEHCKQEISVPDAIKEKIKKELEMIPGDEAKLFIGKEIKLYKGMGCKFCSKKGTKGRIAISEILMMTPELETLTAQHPSEDQIFKEAERQGMVTIKQDGIIKALKGLVTLEEVLKTVED